MRDGDAAVVVRERRREGERARVDDDPAAGVLRERLGNRRGAGGGALQNRAIVDDCALIAEAGVRERAVVADVEWRIRRDGELRAVAEEELTGALPDDRALIRGCVRPSRRCRRRRLAPGLSIVSTPSEATVKVALPPSPPVHASEPRNVAGPDAPPPNVRFCAVKSPAKKFAPATIECVRRRHEAGAGAERGR